MEWIARRDEGSRGIKRGPCIKQASKAHPLGKREPRKTSGKNSKRKRENSENREMEMDSEWTDDDDVQGEADPFEDGDDDDESEAQETEESDSDDGENVLDASQMEDFSDLIAAEREAAREEAQAAAAAAAAGAGAGQGDDARIQGMLKTWVVRGNERGKQLINDLKRC